MIKIDGTWGEGGGQILRSSLGLSLATQKPFIITNIRGKRKKQGLLRQHLTAAKAAKKVCQGQLKGDMIGSKELEFTPSEIVPGEYHFSIGTAGSTALVLQTLLPCIITSKASWKISIEGGTHNPYAPPFDFLKESFIKQLNKAGLPWKVNLKKYGFFPAGGGEILFEAKPQQGSLTFDLGNSGTLISDDFTIYLSELPDKIARQELHYINQNFGLNASNYKIQKVQSKGPGNIISYKMEHKNITNIFTAFGVKGVRAKDIVDQLLSQINTHCLSGSPVDTYLADQLLIPLALNGKGAFITGKPSSHTLTNIHVIKQFLEISIKVSQIKEHQWLITIGEN